MPNGNLGGGLGTQSSPFEIWDVADLDALRGVPNDADNRLYIRFRDNIDFKGSSFEGHFPTIRFANNTASATAYDFVDIDGNNFEIRNFKQMTSNANACGLFKYIDGVVQNLKIVNCGMSWLGGASPVASGVLADVMRSTLVSNVRISGSILLNSSSNANCCGLVSTMNQIAATQPTLVQNCVVNLKVNTVVEFIPFIRSIGATANIIHYYRCVSACNIDLETSTSTALSGFCWGNSGVTYLDSCISQCRFRVLVGNQFGGNIAGFAFSSNSSMFFNRCISKCRFDGSPPSTATNMAVFRVGTLAASSVSQCYAMCEFDLRDSAALINGGNNVMPFDYEVSGMSQAMFNDGADFGFTTEQIKSRAFLESRGWVF